MRRDTRPNGWLHTTVICKKRRIFALRSRGGPWMHPQILLAEFAHDRQTDRRVAAEQDSGRTAGTIHVLADSPLNDTAAGSGLPHC
jgi:hypothetical protein